MPASEGDPVSLPPAVRVDDGDLRRLQKAMRHEQRATLAKQIGAGVAGLVSLVAVLHGILDVVETWKRPPEKPPQPTVHCPDPEDTPAEPFDGICQRLKRAEAKAKSAQADAAECFTAKARLERAIGEVSGELDDLEKRLHVQRRRVTTPGD